MAAKVVRLVIRHEAGHPRWAADLSACSRGSQLEDLLHEPLEFLRPVNAKESVVAIQNAILARAVNNERRVARVSG